MAVSLESDQWQVVSGQKGKENMKKKNDEQIVEIVARYEAFRRKEDSAKYNRELADKELRDHVNRKWKSALSQRVRNLCRQHNRGNDRHWWLSRIDVHPSIDHSVTPWKVSAWARVEIGLYIHEDGEVARDELKFSFRADEAEIALARVGRMMASGLG